MKKVIDMKSFQVRELLPIPDFQGVSPKYGEVSVNEKYLLKNQKPWLPIMGEFHYSRYPEEFWEESILKMKAGGIDIISTYVIWIHHEELQGQFEWQGNKNLHKFIDLCKKHEVMVFLRIGPWSHGECRNGGFPDWLQHMDIELRSNDPTYIKFVEVLYSQIYDQVKGLFFKDGGPIVGIQLENEYGHCGGLNGKEGKAHIRKLKEIAVKIGFEVPLYTTTGWGNGVVVEGETLPVLGGYADAPWTQNTKPLDPPKEYVISHILKDTTIGSDLMKEGPSEYDYDVSKYPYFTAELGGGIQVTAHRRPLVSAADVEAIAFTKLASGANLLGFYMYHGGTNPMGHLSTLQESRATGYLNDLPEFSYDFQAPIREFGQISDKYRYLKILSMFARDFGEGMAAAACFIPEDTSNDAKDSNTLRYSVRLGENAGYVFVNNYQRFAEMACRQELEFEIKSPVGKFEIPAVNLPDKSYIFMPFNMKLGNIRLISANVQPLCTITSSVEKAYVFWGVPSNKAVYNLSAENIALVSYRGNKISCENNRYTIEIENCDAKEGIDITTASGEKITIITLSRENAENAWKIKKDDKEYLIISKSDVIQSEKDITVSSRRCKNDMFIYPNTIKLKRTNGADVKFIAKNDKFSRYEITFEKVLPTVSAKLIEKDKGIKTYELNVEKFINDSVDDNFLLINFDGDTAELFIENEKAADWFYNGETLEVGLKRYLGKLANSKLKLVIHELKGTDDIYFDVPPEFSETSVCCIKNVDIVPEYKCTIEL
ncbi:beta-galactosidase [Clostridium oryzae]|uniref:Beta-galactosidase n=1 Tax=Clostridium oryzae TaxID=1450648 RepID=A0A1V4IPU7_9CLOT|nr:beta-galactosidase [Clostridium oryzae]OPJ61946.1 beta-galactosidase precursor [Clostridium oryzae]